MRVRAVRVKVRNHPISLYLPEQARPSSPPTASTRTSRPTRASTPQTWLALALTLPLTLTLTLTLTLARARTRTRTRARTRTRRLAVALILPLTLTRLLLFGDAAGGPRWEQKGADLVRVRAWLKVLKG